MVVVLVTGQDAPADLLAFIRRGYELWNAGDLETVSRMWAEDFEFHTAPEWPGQRVYRGREQVVRFLRTEVAGVIGLSDIEVEAVAVFGDELVIRLLARTRGRESELDLGKVPVFHVARLSDGRVARVRVYLDEGQAIAAASAAVDARKKLG
jgi:ketosteroid isomerase-like protein